MHYQIQARFGQRVRELRKRARFSQEDLAEASGLHRNYIGGIERGERNPSLINIARLAVALDVLPTALLDGISKTELEDLELEPESPPRP